eukprot:7992239-Pyramimonas_sp.AAC.1
MDSLAERARKPIPAAEDRKALKRRAALPAVTAQDTPASNQAEKVTPVKKDPKKSPNAKKAAKAGAKSTPPKAVAKAAMKYPGIPTKKREPMRIGYVSVYSDVVKQGWRARPQGQRVDVKFSWKVDGPQSWKNLVQYLSDQKAI